MSETIIKLTHVTFENDIVNSPVSDKCSLDEIIEEISNLACTHVPNRIYTWANKVDTSVPVDFEVAFDVSSFYTEIKDLNNIQSLTGKDKIIQDSIMRHPLFMKLAQEIVKTVNEKKPREIGFICNYGKHRSVGWAYILREYIFKRSVVHNYTLRS
jgi:RNase adaptor protein for sRNA GlmZ degradation